MFLCTLQSWLLPSLLKSFEGTKLTELHQDSLDVNLIENLSSVSSLIKRDEYNKNGKQYSNKDIPEVIKQFC